MTPREAAIVALGHEAVGAYEEVKTFYTRFGLELERGYAAAVGGRVGRRGEADVVTRLGDFELCAAANTKNAAGDRAQREKVGPCRVVQLSGTPRRGRISGLDFLELHGIRHAARVAGELEVAAMERARQEALGAALPRRTSRATVRPRQGLAVQETLA